MNKTSIPCYDIKARRPEIIQGDYGWLVVDTNFPPHEEYEWLDIHGHWAGFGEGKFDDKYHRTQADAQAALNAWTAAQREAIPQDLKMGETL